MRYRRCRGTKSAVLTLVLSSLLSSAAIAQQKQSFDIPAEGAAAAIQRWAQQSGLQVFAAEDDLRGIRTNAVHGDYAAVEAAQLLIAGTGLEVIASGENTITIRRTRPASPASGAGDDKFSNLASESLMEILVTGSRIKRPNYDTLQATVVTEAAELERRAYTNVGQALEATPGFMQSDSSPLSTTQSTQTVGQTFVNFFGLGSQRTLTLVNGRRFVSSNSASSRGGIPGSQVDLNTIPAGLVERIETVAIGGAPVYGSDAIAGTVNVILRDDFEGIQGSAVYGVTDEDDAQTEAYRLLMGGNFAEDRGNAVISVEYNEQKGLMMRDRTDVADFWDNPDDTGPADGIPSQVAVRRFRYGILTDGGLPMNPAVPLAGFVHPALFPNGNYVFDSSGTPLQFGANGDLVPFHRGTLIFDAGTGAPIIQDGGDGMDPSRRLPLLAPTKRTLINGMAHYDVAPAVRLFTEASFAHTEGVEQSEIIALAEPAVFNGPALTYSVDNPFLTSQARSTLIANGLTDFVIARNLSDLLDRTPGTTEVDLYRIVAGFQGDFPSFGGETWSWDIAYNYGRSRSTSSLEFINEDRLLEAIDAIPDGSGGIVCASGNPDCAPLNLFGENNFSNAALDYVTDPSRGISTNTLEMVTANLSGRLPFGIAEPISFNVGYEHRREAAAFDPDALQENGVLLTGGGFGFEGISGSFETDEVYSELVVPVISDQQNLPIVKSLSVEGAVRYVDHSLTDTATTWSGGLRIAPRLPGWGDGLLFRGVFTHAIRSPAVTELFLGKSPVATGLTDICNQDSYNQGINPAVREANCRAALAAVGGPAPEAFDETTDLASVVGTQSGNPNLENEEADSWSVGIVYQPVEHPQLRFAADWSNIRLEGGIEDLPIGQLMLACYDSPDFPNVPACGQFHRLTAAEAAAQQGPARIAGDVANGFKTGYINTSKIEFEGLIVEAGYSLELPSVASSLHFGTKLFYMDEFRTTSFAGVPSDNSAGLIGVPRVRLNFDVGYSWRNIDLGLQARWTDKVIFDRNNTIEDVPFNQVDAYTLLNGSIGYRFSDKVSFLVSIDNLTNKEMPFEALINRAVAQYDLIGRRYFATVRANF
ncbi:MAG TPA: TonB-dependent receptor [Steroidobacteraceae bacterium]|nr:TonB-dependent receptor [Steroidobacteraceae bacterium]